MAYLINGSPADIVDAVNLNGTIYVPCAAVTEALGGSVEWKHDSKNARVEVNGKVAWIQPDNANAVVDGLGVDLQAVPFIESDSLWVPARLYRDGFGLALSVEGTDVSISG